MLAMPRVGEDTKTNKQEGEMEELFKSFIGIINRSKSVWIQGVRLQRM